MSTYGFRLTKSEEDKELAKILDCMTGKERSAYIRRALYFYIKYDRKIDNIETGINKLLSKMELLSKMGKIDSLSNRDREVIQVKKPSEEENVLYNSIQNLLNL